jgi:DNA-binding NtrC family response regulator
VSGPEHRDDSKGTTHDPLSAAARPAPAKLVVVSGPDAGLEIDLDGKVHAGTSGDNELTLGDEHVSRRHATFARVAGHVVVTDEGSLNGTFINGTRIKEAEAPLGSVVHLGRRTAVAVRPRWYAREVPPSARPAFGGLLGQSIAMREVFGILERVAPTDLTVLIEGETGTGKEVAARSIHDASPRAGGPYVVFDCGAVQPHLAESELFGHKKGAFTGAIADRAGAFQRAGGGTLCLDEIGELPLELQPNLLRVLETCEMRSVGDDVTRKVDVRVIAATNRELRAEVARGAFREDLFHRLDVVRVRIPPLRHRPEEIPLLVGHFLRGRIDPQETPEGENLRRLMAYPWSGNVRELRNTLLRAAAMATRPGGPPPRFSGLVFNLGAAPESPTTIGNAFPGVETPLPYKDAKERLLAAFERAYVEAALERHDGNITRAAEAAGLSRKHLRELARRYVGGPAGDDGDDSGSEGG